MNELLDFNSTVSEKGGKVEENNMVIPKELSMYLDT